MHGVGNYAAYRKQEWNPTLKPDGKINFKLKNQICWTEITATLPLFHFVIASKIQKVVSSGAISPRWHHLRQKLRNIYLFSLLSKHLKLRVYKVTHEVFGIFHTLISIFHCVSLREDILPQWKTKYSIRNIFMVDSDRSQWTMDSRSHVVCSAGTSQELCRFEKQSLTQGEITTL